jgi:hypothetical protein
LLMLHLKSLPLNNVTRGNHFVTGRVRFFAVFSGIG